MASFVLVHGAFHGGWCWSRTAPLLRSRGHGVWTPTQTGLGERRHLLSPAVTLDTFVDDVCNVLDAEELTEVVLVGHSFGGITIAGVADRMPARLRRLVFLDSRILEDGQSMLDVDGARSGAWRDAAAAHGGAVPPPPATYFGCRDPADIAWIARQLTPHPVNTLTTPLRLRHGRVGNGLPCTYVACTDPLYAHLEDCRRWARGRPGWDWAEIATGHDAMVSAPDLLAALLERIAAAAG